MYTACRKLSASLMVLIILLVLWGCQPEAYRKTTDGFRPPDTATYQEPYQPQFHFTPASNWMNDPNGLVYYDGEYHLFYQHNPFGSTWGHMSWGHAVSTDLLRWQHLPVALKEENGIMIFSGSAVVDVNNTSGLGSRDNPPMIAVYTGHHTDRGLQDQRIAYSLDRGRTWTKYEGNPVLDEGLADFRDPKVFWHKPTSKWIMAVALSTEQRVRFYGSDNLIDWERLSEFGPAGAAGKRLWECPDLFELPVEGTEGESRWVLQVDVNPGSVAGGSGGQYFVGHFDGKKFVQDPLTKGDTLWVDYGRDFYAVQSYSNIPTSDGRRIWIAWMNNWDYANAIPTSPWRSAMTIPREVRLTKTSDGPRLRQVPVKELESLRRNRIRLADVIITEAEGLRPDFRGSVYELMAVFELVDANEVGINIRKGEQVQTVVGYDVKQQELFIDRTQSGAVTFDSAFATVQRGPLKSVENTVRLHLFVDISSVEVFGNGGILTATDRIFPPDDSEGLEVYARGGTARLVSLDIWKLDSIWDNP
jgi:fructan beta-fructosidase